MHIHQRGHPSSRPGLPFVLLCILLAVLLVAGGASRSDVVGQAIVRAVAWLMVIGVILFGERPALWRAKPVAALLAATTLIALLQLVPLPPALWQMLPGRSLLKGAMIGSGQPQPWRPLTMTPGATRNAAASLIVPVAIFFLATGLKFADRNRLPGLLLGLVVASTLLGLLQFSATGLDNPFINDSSGQVSGSFANRNHFALFMALGCLLAPVWALSGRRKPGWRSPVMMGLILLFVLTILGSGSRGIIIGWIGIGYWCRAGAR